METLKQVQGDRNMAYTLLSYKQGTSFLHRCPAWIKILVIPAVSIAAFYLPPAFALSILALQTLVSFVLRFTVREQLADLRPVIYYAVLLFIAKLIGSAAVVISGGSFYWKDFIISEKETWLLLLKLFCVMQSASLVFKTSTSLQIREGLEKIEIAITRKKKAPVAQTLSIFICFIPQVSKNWQQATRAWKARGGKKSLRMLVVLLPVFFSVGMKQAYNSARAISIRQ